MAVYNILLDVGGLYGDQIHHSGDLDTIWEPAPQYQSDKTEKFFYPAGTRTRDLHGHNVAIYQLSYYSQQKKVLGFYYMQQVPEHSQKLVIGNVKNRKLKAMGAKHKRHFWSTPKALQKEEKMQKRPFH